MRDIKFRGKRTTKDEWAYGSLILNRWIVPRKLSSRGQLFYMFKTAVNVYPETVGQFTGRKSATDEMVFSGDILADPDLDGIKYVVEWDDEMCGFCVVSYGIRGATMERGFDENAGGFGRLDIEGLGEWSTEHIRVIGNIHEEGS